MLLADFLEMAASNFLKMGLRRDADSGMTPPRLSLVRFILLGMLICIVSTNSVLGDYAHVIDGCDPDLIDIYWYLCYIGHETQTSP